MIDRRRQQMGHSTYDRRKKPYNYDRVTDVDATDDSFIGTQTMLNLADDSPDVDYSSMPDTPPSDPDPFSGGGGDFGGGGASGDY